MSRRRARRALVVLALGSWPSLALAGVSAAVGGPYTVDAESSVTVSASGSSASVDCSSVKYRWDWDDDGTYDTTASSSSSATFSAAGIDGPASRTIKVEVSGSCVTTPKTATATTTVTIDNVAPTISSTSGATTTVEGTKEKYGVSTSDVEAADVLTTSWDFGDGSSASTGTSVDHTFPDEGSYTVKVTVTDDDGGTTSSTFGVLVSNASPVVDSASWSSTAGEGTSVAFSASATDPGTADALTYAWDFGDGSKGTGASASHAYADEGSYGVSVTVKDGDGGSVSKTGTISITNVAPSISGVSGDLSGDEGQTLGFVVDYADPGTADTHTVTWDFGDGTTSTAASATASHAYVDEGTYALSVEVCDDDGACDTETASIAVANAAPVITGLTGDAAGDEGSALSYACGSYDPGTSDVLSYAWDFGDGSTGSGDAATHAFVDDGTYTVTCTVTDDDGASTTDTMTVDVANVAPSVTGTPSTSVRASETYSYAPGVDDPGADDAITWSLSGPSGMTLDAKTHAVKWTPTWADIGSYAVELDVQDDDGGKGKLAWTVDVVAKDDDGDGMSDDWEAEVGLDPTKDDAATDPDGDGRTNLVEWELGTDPLTYDGPSVPVVVSPLDGDEVATSAVDLVVEDATDGGGDALTYDFEIYDDAGMTSLVASAAGVAEGEGTTSWTVDAPLVEDTRYWWWASAEDAYTHGDWSAPSAFFYNLANEAPGAPAISAPFDGATTADVTPNLVVAEAVDPDEDPLVYDFEVDDDAGAYVTGASAVAGDGANASWTPDEPLTDGATYCWFAWATDDEGLSGDPSDVACFTVDTSNQAPSAPTITSPPDGAYVESVTPEIAVTNGVDPEGRPTFVVFQVASDATFDGPDLQTATVPAGSDGTTTWTVPEALGEDTWWHVRVLATDGDAYSDWTSATFFVNAENGAPATPALYNPADGAAFGEGDSLSVVNAADPEGQAVTYDFQVTDDGGAVVRGVEGVAEDESGHTAWTPDTLGPGTYTWTARAVDEAGAASEWADPRTIVVAGDDTDDGRTPGDDTGGDEPKTGCGCDAGGGTGGVGVLLALAVVVTRRKRV